MIIFCITDQNFHTVKSKNQTTITGIMTSVKYNDDVITISVNSLAPFAIYKWQKGQHFCISNKLSQISDYIAQFGEELSYEYTASRYEGSKSYVDRTRNCISVSHITNWKEVSIDCTGNIDIIKNDPLFTVPLCSEHGVDLFLSWVRKYLTIAKAAIRENNFIPSLTGGLDTRILTWFWKDDASKLSQYYLKAIKPCDNPIIERCDLEVQVASKVLRRIGLSLTRVEETKGVTFRGLFTENARHQDSLNDPDFIYDYISLHFSDKNLYYSRNCVCPFVDNLYLLLNHPSAHFMRTLLALLFCPNLLDIQLCGFANKPPYFFAKEFIYLIPEVKQFIKEYNLEERVNNIKKEVE